jgi:Mg2+-importing ATPase
LTASVLLVVAVAAILPFTSLATVLGFAPLPPAFMLFVVVAVVTYLTLVEMVKRLFYRWYSLTA